MHAFVVLSFIAVASAGRLGYDYQLGGTGSGEGPILQASSGLDAVTSGLFDSGIGSESSVVDVGFNPGVESGLSSSLGGPVIDGGLNKEFYHYSAPEAEFDNGDAAQRAVSSLRKNLRVVFIKAPENNGLNNAALQLVKQAAGDRTAIYVLSKQPDLSELANQVQGLRQSINQKPEVRFVKYRTPEDAANAQRAIQQQYDALGGSSLSLNEGIAPVLNYASALQQREPVVGDLGGSFSASNLSPSGLFGAAARREYLPPVVY